VNELLAKKSSALRAKFSLTQKSEYLVNALTCLRLAEKLLSKQRNTLDMEAAKWEFLDANYDLYETIIATLSEGAATLPADTINHLAFQYFEQSKARSLADALIQSELSNQISGEDSLFRLHNELKRQLFSAQDAIERELLNNKTKGKLSDFRQEIVKLDQQIHFCKLAIEEKFPGYFNAKYGYHSAPAGDIQKLMKENDQVLLEYFWGSHSIYGIGINDKQIVFKKIGAPDSLNAIINKVLLHLRDTKSNADPSHFHSFTTHAHELYNILIKPFSSLIASHRRLQIIPDGAINQIPFEILLEQDEHSEHVSYRSLKYLLKSFSIGYASSSAMLLHKTRQKRTSKPSLLAVGFTGGQNLRSSDQELADIEGVEKELEALEKWFDDGKFLIDKEATESNFKSLAPNFDIIHLAVHGLGDTEKNFAASLHFRSKSDNKDDGELHAYELYGLKLNALMAVLSSCESGLGKGYRGEGMISMASAFTYSGCKNTLMSLWKVNDQASVKLMDDFYGHISAGETIDDALRMSKLNYLETADELTADPKIWAPLVVYGSLETIFQTDRNRIFKISAFAIFIASILFLSLYLYRRRSHK
jgi:CHAT domain-containing protein